MGFFITIRSGQCYTATMKTNELPIIAAVPNYNMAPQLGRLLPQLLQRGYDAIYVLDDNSSDDSHAVVKAISPEILFVAGKTNRGAGGNRNRIIEQLFERSIIHFIDADMVLADTTDASTVRRVMQTGDHAFVGGLIRKANGQQHLYNFGPRQCLWMDLSSGVHYWLMRMSRRWPRWALRMRHRWSKLLGDWPNPLEPATARDTFWCAESNMVIDSQLFAEMGGYDARLREHEIEDFAMRLAKKGKVGHFDPRIEATHTQAKVRRYPCRLAMIRAEYYIAKKHGFRNWFFPDGHFKPRLPKKRP